MASSSKDSNDPAFKLGDTPSRSDMKGCAMLFGGVFAVVAVLIVIGLAWTAIFGEDELTFQDAVDEGRSCWELIDLRDDQGPNWAGRDDANETLFQLGCTSTDAERQTTTSAPTGSPSTTCMSTLRDLDRVRVSASEAEFEALATQSLTDCGDAASWITAARAFPGALGLVSAGYVTPQQLELWCVPAGDAPVCKDAVAQGWFTPPPGGG